jgi:tyrosine-protein phosphatase SIW14
MIRIFRILLIFAVAWLWTTTMCAGEEPSQKGSTSATPPAHPLGQKREMRGIHNFGEVTPALFRGAQPTHEGFEALAKMGIGIVVDARAGHRMESEGREVRRLGMQYVEIPWHCPSPNDDVFVRFLKVLQENPNKKVFVHCRLGEDRTGMMVAAYRMAEQGWPADEAMQEMHRFGFSSAHHVLCPGLASYEKRFPKHLLANPAFQGLHLSSQSAPQ